MTEDKRGHNRVRVKKANDFLIWRAGNSVGWQCNATDIAREVGLKRQTVTATCKRRGWKLLDGRVDGYEDQVDVVSVMRGMNR